MSRLHESYGRLIGPGVGPVERQYEYKATWTYIVTSGLLFGSAAVYLAAKACENNLRLEVLNIELSPLGARIGCWIMASVSLVFVADYAMLGAVRLRSSQRITLSDSCLSIPRSRWSGRESFVPYSEIFKVSVDSYYGARFLRIFFRAGKFILWEAMLARKQDLDEIYQVLTTRLWENQQQPPAPTSQMSR